MTKQPRQQTRPTKGQPQPRQQTRPTKGQPQPHYHNLICTVCYAERVPPRRAAMQAQASPPQRPTCMTCGESAAQRVKHTVAPLHKSNYMLFTNRVDLVGINNKGGLVK